MRVYKGIRRADGTARVLVAEPDKPDRLLPPRTDLFRRCATGLDWGYAGNGPAQCALALLADALRDDERAVRVHWGFHCHVIAALPRHLPWQLTQEQVVAAVQRIETPARLDKSVTGAKVMAAGSSSPGLSRRSRSRAHGAPMIAMAGTSPAMTEEKLPRLLPVLQQSG